MGKHDKWASKKARGWKSFKSEKGNQGVAIKGGSQKESKKRVYKKGVSSKPKGKEKVEQKCC